MFSKQLSIYVSDFTLKCTIYLLKKKYTVSLENVPFGPP